MDYQKLIPILVEGLNFTLKTKLGNLGLFGEIVGGGKYEDLLAQSEKIEVLALDVNV